MSQFVEQKQAHYWRETEKKKKKKKISLELEDKIISESIHELTHSKVQKSWGDNNSNNDDTPKLCLCITTLTSNMWKATKKAKLFVPGFTTPIVVFNPFNECSRLSWDTL